jgi:hypothetical protein
MVNARAMAVLAGGSLAAASVLCFACGRPVPGSLNRPLSSFEQEITSPLKRLRMRPNQAIQLPVVVRNIGPEIWVSRGVAPVVLSYKWFANDAVLPAEGERTTLPGVLRPGDAISIQLRIVAPERTGSVVLAVSLVQEGVAWFLSNGGSALRIPVQLAGNESALSNEQRPPFADEITSRVARLSLQPMQVANLPVTIRNVSGEVWSSAGTEPVMVSYKWFDNGKMLSIEGERTWLPGIVRPGDTVSLSVRVVAPAAGRNLMLKVTLVQEGVAWFMSKGAKTLDIPVVLH